MREIYDKQANINLPGDKNLNFGLTRQYIRRSRNIQRPNLKPILKFHITCEIIMVKFLEIMEVLVNFKNSPFWKNYL